MSNIGEQYICPRIFGDSYEKLLSQILLLLYDRYKHPQQTTIQAI